MVSGVLVVEGHERSYPGGMKRTRIALRSELIEEARRLSGEKTASRVVERALEDYVRRIRAGQIVDLCGSGKWEGDLGKMRHDS